MKNKLLKIFGLIIVFIALFEINVNAASFNISASSNNVKVGNEVTVKINTDKNLEAATFYINYNKSVLEFVEKQTDKVTVKDYPDEGILRVVYLDPSMKGNNELAFKFKVKEEAQGTSDVKITNLTLQFIDDSTVYTNTNLKESNFEISITAVKEMNTILKVSLIVNDNLLPNLDILLS